MLTERGRGPSGPLTNKMDNLINWLEAELAEAESLQAEYAQRGEDTEYSNYEEEIERHEQEGYVWAIKYVIQHVKGMK